MGTITTDAFVPNRGTEENVAAQPVQDGNVFFTKDTNRIFCDMDGERHLMGNSGIGFVYGNAEVDQIVHNSFDDTDSIPKTYIQPDEPYPYYEVGTIIVNVPDSTFYQITEINDTAAICKKLLVSGSGGDAAQTFSLLPITPFTGSYNYTDKIVGTFRIRDSLNIIPEADVQIDYYDSKDQATPTKTEYMSAVVGKDFTITLDNSVLNVGKAKNYIKITASTSDGREAFQEYNKFQIFQVTFGPQKTTWNDTIKTILSSNKKLDFPWIVEAPSDDAIPEGMSVSVTYQLDGIYEYTPTAVIEKKGSGYHSLLSFVTDSGITHGGHELHVVAKMSYSNMPEGGELTIGDYSYGFGWAETDKTDPVIWTNYHEAEVENYTTIDIPYMVYDPSTSSPEISFYLNGDFMVSTTYEWGSDWGHWKVTDYIAGTTNTFTLNCRGTQVSLSITVLNNASVNLEAISNNNVLYLNALGRSNNEIESKRVTWTNKGNATGSNIKVGEPILEGFNWVTNGWIDLDSEGTQVLRISNGAKVTIPLQSLSYAQAQAQTYEFEFKVRNATNYSKLVNYTTKLDDSGNPVVGSEGQELIEKTVSNGEGAFLNYFNSTDGVKKGILLGTQEALFSIGATSVLNVRYTDNEKVKVSFAINPNDTTVGGLPIIYAYINSVLTGVYNFKGEDNNFNANLSNLVINSEYCDVDIYSIRIYDTFLSYSQITQNWVGDAPTLEERWNRYNRNQKILKNDDIDYLTVKESGLIPVMVLTTYNRTVGDVLYNDLLPYKKGNKIAVDIRFYNPWNLDMNFHAQNIQCDVQGTSSQAYPRRNYKIKFKTGNDALAGSADAPDRPFKMGPWSGIEKENDTYPEEDTKNSYMEVKTKKGKGTLNIGTGIQESAFCLKADFMDSSGTHNTCLANYIQYLSVQCQDLLAHPLIKDFGLKYNENTGLRTTIYGFPMLLFHQDSSGDISYVGKYNFNLDKSDTDTFGFSNETLNPYTESLKEGVHTDAKAFTDVAECWELVDNQGGMGKFKLPSKNATDFYTKIAEGEDNAGRYLATTAFEMRYLGTEYDILEAYESTTPESNPLTNAEADAEARESYKNLAAVWEWTASTDTTAATNAALTESVYYPTLSDNYDSSLTYYTNIGDTEPATITHVLQVSYKQHDNEASGAVTINNDTFLTKFSEVRGLTSLTDQEEIIDKSIGVWLFELEDNTWYFTAADPKVEVVLSDWGIELPASYAYSSFDIGITAYYNGFSTTLYEKFDIDSTRYRLSKFKAEFTNHWDLNYTTFYFVLTELLLLYDSRQKNMMLATWGPKKFKTNTSTEIVPGDYIWYPIFYDMDTQLGINNSGQVYWDYDVDATPEDGVTASIFSGNGSVLWDNFFACFKNNIKEMYRTLRTKVMSLSSLITYYDTNGSDVWSEAMKNIDADYKYLAPAARGYISVKGETVTCDDKYFYCLQGDRKLNRDAFFRNRLNYIDSEWLGGTYEKSSIDSQVKMRYNLNDKSDTSDSVTGLKSNASFEITPYLSQYVSVLYDETATVPQKFSLKDGTSIKVEPPSNIAEYVGGSITLSQQLAYIRGPEYLSDIGDLSLKYVNEFDCTPATRLKALRLGNETEGYYNGRLESKDLVINGGEGSESKQLLQYIDLTNLNLLDKTIDLQGCIKLQVFKGLGTKLPSVLFPNGNSLKKVYLPNTITQLILKQAFELTDLIDNAADTKGDSSKEGLYIAGLTDNLDNPTCNIDKLQIENSKLGFNSYKIFNALYNSITTVNASLASGNKKHLALQLVDVDWSNFSVISDDITYSSSTVTNYYCKLDNETYEQLPAGFTLSQWNQGVLDGIIFKRSEDSLVKNLDFLDVIIGEYNNANIEKQDFQFRNINDDALDANKKVLPKITGRIHVENDESNPIDENQILNYYNKYFPDLEITANYVTAALRVTFVEYDTNGARVVLAKQKIAKGDTVSIVYPEETNPVRSHHDFQGWMIVVSDGTTAADYQVAESTIRKNYSVMTKGTKVYSNLNDETLQTYLNEQGSVVLAAIYFIHTYNVTFYEYDNQSVLEVVGINSGNNMHGPASVPYKPIAGEGTLYKCNKFLGWTNSLTSKTPLTIEKIRVSTDMEMYPVFEENASVYDNLLTADELTYTWDSSLNGWVVGINTTKLGKNEKICFPKILTDPANTHVDGPIVKIADQAFYNNQIITHVFFEGAQDNTSNLLQIGLEAFCADTNMVNSLVYIDLPSSIQVISNYAFALANFSSMTSLTSLGSGTKITGAGIFVNAAHYGENWPEALILPGTRAFVGENMFNQSGWKEYYIGTAEEPLTEDVYNIYQAAESAGSHPWEYGRAENVVVPQKITIYAKGLSEDATTIQETFKNLIQGYDSSIVITVVK